MNYSLRFRLCAWITAAVLLAAALAGFASFESARTEANELQDAQLTQIGTLLDARDLSVPPPQNLASTTTDPDLYIEVQILGRPDVDDKVVFPSNLLDGLHTLSINHEEWRLYVISLDNGDRIAVGQRTAERDEIANIGAMSTIVPLLVLIPVLLAMIISVITLALRPVARLSQQIDHDPNRCLQSPLSVAQLPDEVAPLVRSINRLLARQSRQLEQQKRFISDAAHELRSPMTALMLQAENLSAADMSETARERLQRLQAGLGRSAALIEQLLSLSRAQAQTAAATQSVRLVDVLHKVLEDLVPQAQARDIDIGVVAHDDVGVAAYELDVATLMRNLLDNAIKYTPPGGTIDIGIHHVGDEATFEVRDSGTGVPDNLIDQLWRPFFRVPGTTAPGAGLGLSIVSNIVDKLSGRVSVRNVAPDEGSGLIIAVHLPAQP